MTRPATISRNNRAPAAPTAGAHTPCNLYAEEQSVLEKSSKPARRKPETALAWHLQRLGLKLVDLQRLSREPYGTLKNYHYGRARTPRSLIRLLAAWRLLHWNEPR